MKEEQLPASYTASIKEMLGQEADAFLESYSAPRTQGLRFNPLKSTSAIVPSCGGPYSLTI